MNLRQPGNRLKGILAERLAALAYLLRGYVPARRPARALAQTDLLFTRGSALVLVEVKYRPRETAGHLALTPAQKNRLMREAGALQKHYPHHHIRLDLCLVFPHWPFVRRVQNIAGQ